MSRSHDNHEMGGCADCADLETLIHYQNEQLDANDCRISYIDGAPECDPVVGECFAVDTQTGCLYVKDGQCWRKIDCSIKYGLISGDDSVTIERHTSPTGEVTWDVSVDISVTQITSVADVIKVNNQCVDAENDYCYTIDLDLQLLCEQLEPLLAVKLADDFAPTPLCELLNAIPTGVAAAGDVIVSVDENGNCKLIPGCQGPVECCGLLEEERQFPATWVNEGGDTWLYTSPMGAQGRLTLTLPDPVTASPNAFGSLITETNGAGPHQFGFSFDHVRDATVTANGCPAQLNYMRLIVNDIEDTDDQPASSLTSTSAGVVAINATQSGSTYTSTGAGTDGAFIYVDSTAVSTGRYTGTVDVPGGADLISLGIQFYEQVPVQITVECDGATSAVDADGVSVPMSSVVSDNC